MTFYFPLALLALSVIAKVFIPYTPWWLFALGCAPAVIVYAPILIALVLSLLYGR